MTGKIPNPAPLAPISDPPHPRSWQKLETIGDCQRALRWLFLETKRGRLDSRKAATMAVIAAYITKTIEQGELEKRILRIESEQQGADSDRTIHITVGGRPDETT